MKKVALIAPEQLELQENCPDIMIRPDTVKIEVSACGICGSDLALLTGTRSLENEHYFGHEFSGIVVDAGEGHNGLQVGMRVASELVKTCGQCWNCRNGLPNYCRSMNDALLPGGFSSETLVLNTPSYCFLSPIPDTLDDITATLLEPANCAYRIASKANIRPGDSVLIFGLGTMGLITAEILKSMGAGSIIGTDRNKVRLEKIRQTSLLDVVDCNDADWMEQVKERTGSMGVDIVIEATGASAVLADTFEIVRPGGTIVAGGVYHGSVTNFVPTPIMRKELTIVGAKGPYPSVKSDGTSVVVDIVNKLQNNLKKLINVYDYSEGLTAFCDMRSGVSIKPVIKLK